MMSFAACISAKLVRRLDHPAAANDRIGADVAQARKLLAKPVEDEEAVGLLEADRLRCDAALAEEVGDELQRLLVLVPGADLGGDRQALGDRRALEEGRDDDRIARRRNDRGGQPLGAPPLDAGEIVEARPGLDDDRADAVLAASAASPSRSARAARPTEIGGGIGIGFSASAAAAMTRDRRAAPSRQCAAAAPARKLRRSIIHAPLSDANVARLRPIGQQARSPCSIRLSTTA